MDHIHVHASQYKGTTIVGYTENSDIIFHEDIL